MPAQTRTSRVRTVGLGFEALIGFRGLGFRGFGV